MNKSKCDNCYVEIKRYNWNRITFMIVIEMLLFLVVITNIVLSDNPCINTKDDSSIEWLMGLESVAYFIGVIAFPIWFLFDETRYEYTEKRYVRSLK